MSIDHQNSAKISHILGVDFGKAKIGLAMADNETKIAFGYETIENNKELLENLKELITKEKVEKVIIGKPSHSLRDKKESGEKTLGNLIKNNLGVAVEYAEEMFTTKMAQDNLKETGVKNIGKIDDKESARIILQGWLDSHPNF